MRRRWRKEHHGQEIPPLCLPDSRTYYFPQPYVQQEGRIYIARIEAVGSQSEWDVYPFHVMVPAYDAEFQGNCAAIFTYSRKRIAGYLRYHRKKSRPLSLWNQPIELRHSQVKRVAKRFPAPPPPPQRGYQLKEVESVPELF